MMLRSWLAKGRAALIGLGIGGVLVGALWLYATGSTLLNLAGVADTAGHFRLPTRSSAPIELPPAKELARTGRHAPKVKPRPVDLPPVPILEPASLEDALKIDKKFGTHIAPSNGQPPKEDVVASGDLGHGSVLCVVPRDGSPARQVYVAKTFELGGAINLRGDALMDLKGSVLAGVGGLEADLVRWKRLQFRGGPGWIYDRERGSRLGVLFGASLCLAKCG